MTKKGEVNCGFVALAAVLLLAAVGSPPAAALTKGMVIDPTTSRAVVFDADTDTVLGSVAVPPSYSGLLADCSITMDQKLGFLAGFGPGVVWVIDLDTISLASGTNPIHVSNYAEEVSITPDGKYVVVSDGYALAPISVIDMTTRSEIDTLLLPGGCDSTSVDVCSDGSVLATSYYCRRVSRLTIDAAGNLSDTGESLNIGGLGKDGPNNVVCGPGGKSGFTVLAWSSPEVLSFGIPGLGPVDDRALSGACGESGLVNPSGTVAYVRSDGGFVDAWSYDPATGSLGLSPLLSFPVSDPYPDYAYFGIEVMAIHPNGAKLYVSERGKLNVYDSSTGALLKSITDASIVSSLGVCIAPPAVSTVPFDIKPGVCPNPLYPSLRGKLPAAILGFAGFDVNRVDPASVRLEGVAPLKYEYQDVAAPFVPFTGKSDCKKDCTTAGPDGYLDLVLYFDNQAVARAINPPPRVNRECRVLKMTGKLKAALGGTSIAGEDVVIIQHEI